MAKVAAAFIWFGMKQDMQQFVKTYEVCQKMKSSNQAPAGLLQPLPIPDKIWQDLAMDFITRFPLSNGYTTILVVVDRLSKQAHIGALPQIYSAPKVANLFTQLICRLHGIPTSIVSDRDAIFFSKFWTELFTLSGTVLKRSTTYHPQTDGQSEVINRILQQCLCCFVAEYPKKWHKYLHWDEYCYNVTFQSS